MALLTFINFCYKNYLRQHRYLRELIAIVIFSIFFGGFLTGDHLDDSIWWVFTVFAVLLNLLTSPSLFFLEKGNTLTFLLSKPHGRTYLFMAKVILIILIDLFWVLLFAVLYGLRFLSLDYFLILPLRLFFVAFVLLLSTLLLSLSYSFRPQLSWLIIILLVFGCIVNKSPMFPPNSLSEILKLLIFLLPPFFEISFITVSLDFSHAQAAFLGVALIQIVALLLISLRQILRKDFL